MLTPPPTHNLSVPTNEANCAGPNLLSPPKEAAPQSGMGQAFQPQPKLHLLSVVIPARDEETCIASTVSHLHLELQLNQIEHEIIVVDDGSRDQTATVVARLGQQIPEVRLVKNGPPHGFGRAIIAGLRLVKGDGVVIMMADESDDCGDVARYWNLLNQGWDAVFGSRFVKGGGVIDYPWLKLCLNRMANLFIRILFGISLNDSTNAFKAYRRTAIEGCQPLLSAHFNLTVELPLKAIVRGYSWTVMPITWRNRRTGLAKLKIQEMGSRYLFICLYLWLEKHLSCGDYKRPEAICGREVQGKQNWLNRWPVRFKSSLLSSKR
jgi:dolichol-phosphate mannosyltransferase